MAEDIFAYESQHGVINSGEIVLVRTGWSQHYHAGPKIYLGYDEELQGPYNSKTSVLTFPGIGLEAAQVLVDRQIAAVGIDTGKKNVNDMFI